MPWMFALDHINYARCLSVHVRDMTSLPTSHPSVYQQFTNGAYAVRKSTHAFSAIALDHAHEQENSSIKVMVAPLVSLKMRVRYDIGRLEYQRLRGW